MSNFLIWRRSPAGPSIAILHGHKNVDENDLRYKITEPMQICEQHENLSLAELAKLYPCPAYKLVWEEP